jgi:LPXTG-motif cell wall-anchored protein
MKKFSLKALGATLLGFVLAIATLAAPANASATADWNGTAPTFTTGLSPAMNIDFNTTSTAPFRQVAIGIRNSAGTDVPIGVTVDASTGNCKLTSLTGTNVTNLNFCNRYSDGDGGPGQRIAFSVDASSYGSFNLQVQSGVFGGLSNGSYTLWVGTTDDFRLVESATIPFTIGPPPTPAISPSSLSINGTVGSPITATAGFTASNFVGSVTYAAANRPAGLSINSSSGVISGTPTTSGSGAFTVTATGATSGSAQATVTFSFGSPPTAAISPSSLSINGTAGTSITPTAGFTASNFVGSVTYAAPNRPSGLSINSSTGVISGTPSNSGSGTFTVTATGATSGSAQSTVTYSIGSGGGGGSITPAATITLGASQGQLVAGSSVGISASGLQATAPYTVVVQSTPQTLGTGNAVSGAVNTSVTLPSNLGAGWHTLTFSSTASDGSPMTSVLYFEVSSTGTLLATSSTKPAALANTGFDGMPFIASGVALMILGAGVMLVTRRKSA